MTAATDPEAFADLLAANSRYARQHDLKGFDGIARAGVAIVTCMDSRIEPLHMVGLTHGDAKIFCNPGGRVTEAAAERAEPADDPDPDLDTGYDAAIRAAREAAQGRGPARPADTGPAAPATSGVGWEDEVASDDDVPLEDSGLVGRAVVERVLGGRLLEERPNDA